MRFLFFAMGVLAGGVAVSLFRWNAATPLPTLEEKTTWLAPQEADHGAPRAISEHERVTPLALALPEPEVLQTPQATPVVIEQSNPESLDLVEMLGIALTPVDEQPVDGLLPGYGQQTLDNGVLTAFYDNGAVAEQGEWNGTRTGHWVHWSKDGNKAMEGQYVDGLAVGTWRGWHSNGVLNFVASCRLGKLDGVCQFWLADGQVDKEKTGMYRDGERQPD